MTALKNMIFLREEKHILNRNKINIPTVALHNCVKIKYVVTQNEFVS